MRTAYISHSTCLRHEMIDGHPECPERIGAIEDRLLAAGIFDFLQHYNAPAATTWQLRRIHRREHVRKILSGSPKKGLFHLDPDTYMNPHTARAAVHAAGAVVLGTNLVIKGKVDNAFCCVRPPGHHAEKNEAMGFCFFNNVAVGAAHALAKHGLERVAIIDFDVHHGNGTENIFENEKRVMVCSAYQHPFYPYSGRPTVDGRLINVELKAGTTGKEFREALTDQWFPQLYAFQPQMIFISAGFDAHTEDDIAELNLTEQDYTWITREIMVLAERYAENRIVSVLEGGYNLHALGRSVTAHVKALMRL
uniref:Acetoin utilization deacetylase AcuC n=1 Tax=Candidatus Kentrum sp. TUN TaxID=2126343 RepID=A0A450ZPW5_9GAMM|nr:MAG: Acetoin utilization deacetylase AcuC [Candidatus Kentron sp. TUN]VFK55784.1 MAG: Acetoin utilization deacetylase AcuC [Candidatus Kentron sp. TUN]VFK61806.1 MAG: Acetoin utilization deacetylase AcuC [Candidatus Kentron sp. TUN]